MAKKSMKFEFNNNEIEDKENLYGARLFTEEDEDVLQDFDMISFIFETVGYCPWINISEFQKYYDLIEKGYTLSKWQKQRLSNAYLFCMKSHEKAVKCALDMAKAAETPKEIEMEEDPFKAFKIEEIK